LPLTALYLPCRRDARTVHELVIMEAVYVIRGGKSEAHDALLGVLFGINFAMGVATGITMSSSSGHDAAPALAMPLLLSMDAFEGEAVQFITRTTPAGPG